VEQPRALGCRRELRGAPPRERGRGGAAAPPRGGAAAAGVVIARLRRRAAAAAARACLLLAAAAAAAPERVVRRVERAARAFEPRADARREREARDERAKPPRVRHLERAEAHAATAAASRRRGRRATGGGARDRVDIVDRGLRREREPTRNRSHHSIVSVVSKKTGRRLALTIGIASGTTTTAIG